MRTAAVIAAAGSGSRLGRAEPKALVHLGGEPLVRHAARRLLSSGCVAELVVVAPADQLNTMADALAGLGEHRITVIAGGATRQQSVASGLGALSSDISHVLIHDAARALVPPALVSSVVAALADGAEAVIPAIPVVDTIRCVAPDNPNLAEALLDRTRLRAIQTPQGFMRTVICRAHEEAARANREATDDAALVADLGVPISLVAGDEIAGKITTAIDLALAEVLLAAEGGS